MHKLDNNQQINKLLDMPPLQVQKPSDMLAKMQQLCTISKDNTAMTENDAVIAAGVRFPAGEPPAGQIPMREKEKVLELL